MLDALHYEKQGKEILRKRGIFTEASVYGWEVTRYEVFGKTAWGWVYPVYSASGKLIGKRWKALDKTQERAVGRKYAWVPSMPDTDEASWYFVSDIVKAVHDNGGVCYLANGEPSLLAYHAGGVHNVVATTLGEGSIPDDAIYKLISMGVYRLIYPFDNDKAGRASASKWRDALAGSGIDFEALTFEGVLPEKGDANDLWIEANFIPRAFQEMLKGLSIGRLLPPPKKTEYGRYEGNVETDQELANAIASHFGLTGSRVNSKGFYTKKVRCPFHDDKRPSAGIAQDSGVLNCFSGCGVIDPVSVAEAIGIDTSQFKSKTKHVKAPLSDKAQALEDCTELIPKLLDLMKTEQRLLLGNQKITPSTLSSLYIIRQSLLDGDAVTTAQLKVIETAKDLLGL